MKKLILISLLAITSIAKAQIIDAQKSFVSFEIDNMKFKTVEGILKGMKGKVVFDKNNLSNSFFKVSIDPSTINTESDMRDNHLRNEDFFYVEKYKTIDFVSDKILKSNDGYITEGKMTLHGVTKKVTIPFDIRENGDEIIFEGSFQLNRFDYGLGAKEYNGTFMIDDEVRINIVCVVKN